MHLGASAQKQVQQVVPVAKANTRRSPLLPIRELGHRLCSPAASDGCNDVGVQETGRAVGSAEEVLNDERQRTVAAVSSGRQVVQ